MPLPLDQGHGRTVCCLLCLGVNLFLSSIAAAQLTGNGVRDTTSTSKHAHYFSCTVLTGSAVQFFRKRTGLFSVSFPYSAVDGSGATTTGTFSAEQRNIFGSARAFVGPLAFEAGRRHDFVHFELSFPTWKRDIRTRLEDLYRLWQDLLYRPLRDQIFSEPLHDSRPQTRGR